MGCWNTCIFLVYVCTIGVSQTSKALRGPPCFGGPVLGVTFLGVWSVLVYLGLLLGFGATWCKMFFFFFWCPRKTFGCDEISWQSIENWRVLAWLQRMSYLIHLFWGFHFKTFFLILCKNLVFEKNKI
jgi:hypothetical protein